MASGADPLRGNRRKDDDAPMSPELERQAREAESRMRYEVIGEMQAVKHSVDVVDDLVWLLFGAGSTRAWRR